MFSLSRWRRRSPAHDGDVIVSIDSVTASAATTRRRGGKGSPRIADSGLLMIHNSWTIAWGNAEEIRKTADLLDKGGRRRSSPTTPEETGASEQQVRDWMAAETWFNAQEALDNKFVDAIDSTTQAAVNKWDLSAYQTRRNSQTTGDTSPHTIANRERKLRLLSLT